MCKRKTQDCGDLLQEYLKKLSVTPVSFLREDTIERLMKLPEMGAKNKSYRLPLRFEAMIRQRGVKVNWYSVLTTLGEVLDAYDNFVLSSGERHAAEPLEEILGKVKYVFEYGCWREQGPMRGAIELNYFDTLTGYSEEPGRHHPCIDVLEIKKDISVLDDPSKVWAELGVSKTTEKPKRKRGRPRKPDSGKGGAR